jgi:hypothetical protein
VISIISGPDEAIYTAEDFATKLCQQKNWLLLHQIFFLPKTTRLPASHHLYFSLFPQLKIKLKGRHFDTTELIEAEWQAVLNTLTEHDFQYAFKKRQALGTVHTRGRELQRKVMVASRPKVSF